jgi:hypothetical protein
MAGIRTATAEELRTAIEDIYDRSDELMDSLSPQDWRRKHGDDWVMADVPYHLAYFDRVLVADALEHGEAATEAERFVFDTPNSIDAWNAERFAERPAGQTVEEAREQLAAVRADIRARLASLTDDNLEAQAWMPLAGLGWRPARTVLGGCLMHNFSEHLQWRIRLGIDGFGPAPETAHIALDGFLRTMPMTMNREEASDPFAARFSITSPGGGDWLLQTRDGDCEVSEDGTAPADVTMSMADDTFVRMASGISNPMWLMLTRRIKLKGMRRMMRFQKVFPPPRGDTQMRGELVKM